MNQKVVNAVSIRIINTVIVSFFFQNKSKEVLRSTLYIKKAKESSFRTYELVAENMVGVSAHAARLIRSKYVL